MIFQVVNKSLSCFSIVCISIANILANSLKIILIFISVNADKVELSLLLFST